MLQSIATIAFVGIGACALALIASVLADDWRTVRRALALRRPIAITALPPRLRRAADRRARVVRVSSQSAPRHAAA
jgi:hypothetical protein